MDQDTLQALESRLSATLLGWGVASSAVGTGLWLAGWRTGNRELLRFGRMTAAWGATDAAIAILGSVDRRRRGVLSPAEVDIKARVLRITLVANAIADVAYLAGGARVLARTRPKHRAGVTSGLPSGTGASASQAAGPSAVTAPARESATYWGMGPGDGAAVVVQGAFLLALDTVYALRMRAARKTP